MFHSQPQRLAIAERALASIAEGLRDLAGLGLLAHLAPGPAPVEPEWPRVLFHADAAPNGRLVRDQWEASELGPGWAESFNEAAHGAAVDYQYAARGGVQRRGLPALVPER